MIVVEGAFLFSFFRLDAKKETASACEKQTPFRGYARAIIQSILATIDLNLNRQLFSSTRSDSSSDTSFSRS